MAISVKPKNTYHCQNRQDQNSVEQEARVTQDTLTVGVTAGRLHPQAGTREAKPQAGSPDAYYETVIFTK